MTGWQRLVKVELPLAFVLQGGLIVAALAVLIYDGLSASERYTARRMGRETR